MSNVVHNRGGTDSDLDDLEEIDDTQNGILLNALIHIPLGDGECAFLKTPNFCLNVNDIPYNAPTPVNCPTNRLTLQYFVTDASLGPVIPTIAARNSDARPPADTTEWPPAVIIDLFYACAALKSWGSASFSKYVRDQTRDMYYDNTGDGDSASDDQPRGGELSHTNAPTIGQQSARTICHNKRTGNDMGPVLPAREGEEISLGDWMDGVKALWMQAAREGKQKLPDTEASDLSRKEDNIKGWLQSV